MKRWQRRLAMILLSLPVFLVAGPGDGIPPGFVDVKTIIPSILVELRYQGTHNFIGEPVRGYQSPICYMTRAAATALAGVQRELRPFGLSLKIYDAYRPQQAVDHFVEWARATQDTLMKREFYPEVAKRHLFRDGYIASRSGHSRGSTLDLTIVPLPLAAQPPFTSGDSLCECYRPVGERFADNTLDMGTGYDCFDERSGTASGAVGGQARANRLLLKLLMEKYGFRNYSREWWHRIHHRTRRYRHVVSHKLPAADGKRAWYAGHPGE